VMRRTRRPVSFSEIWYWLNLKTWECQHNRQHTRSGEVDKYRYLTVPLSALLPCCVLLAWSLEQDTGSSRPVAGCMLMSKVKC